MAYRAGDSERALSPVASPARSDAIAFTACVVPLTAVLVQCFRPRYEQGRHRPRLIMPITVECDGDLARGARGLRASGLLLVVAANEFAPQGAPVAWLRAGGTRGRWCGHHPGARGRVPKNLGFYKTEVDDGQRFFGTFGVATTRLPCLRSPA